MSTISVGRAGAAFGGACLLWALAALLGGWGVAALWGLSVAAVAGGAVLAMRPAEGEEGTPAWLIVFAAALGAIPIIGTTALLHGLLTVLADRPDTV